MRFINNFEYRKKTSDEPDSKAENTKKQAISPTQIEKKRHEKIKSDIGKASDEPDSNPDSEFTREKNI